MFGDIIKIAENTFLIEGKEPVTVLREADIASSLVHKSGDILYIMDTGATIYFRNQILKAVESLRPFKKLILLNSHGHPDHTPNNSIINEIESETREHYISEKGFPLLDYAAYFKNNLRKMTEYYYLEDGPGFPFSIIMKPLKILRLINPKIIEEYFLNFIYKRVIKKFMPLEPSIESAVPFEAKPCETIKLKNVTLSGWNFNDDIFVIESRGHTPDSVSFYLPKRKVLFLSDETTLYFNCWTDTNSEKIIDIIQKSIMLYKEGYVDVLIGGHQQEAFRGDKIIDFLETLLADHEIFKNELESALKMSPDGAGINKLYKMLKKRKHLPAIKKYFNFEFPKMPPMLKTNIVCALLEKGYIAEGEKGKKVFK